MRTAIRKDNGTCEVFAQIGMVSVIPAADFVLCAGPDDHGFLFFDERYQYLYYFEGRDGKARSGGNDGGGRKPERLFFFCLSGAGRIAD